MFRLVAQIAVRCIAKVGDANKLQGTLVSLLATRAKTGCAAGAAAIATNQNRAILLRHSEPANLNAARNIQVRTTATALQ